jgi:hypothetical protein
LTLKWLDFHGRVSGRSGVVAPTSLRLPVCRNCGWRHAAKEVCPPHLEARLAGRTDGIKGEPSADERWPSGSYGHADYWIGYYAGQAGEAGAK